MLPLVTLPFFLAAMIADIIARQKQNDALAAVFQPLTTFTVIVAALLGFFSADHRTGLSVGLCIGLVICFAADMILIKRGDDQAFIKGMALFFVALLVYSATLLATATFRPESLIALPFLLAWWAVLLKVLWKGLGRLKLPVMLYGLAFVLCVICAVNTCFSPGFRPEQGIMLVAGTTLFLLGDSQLAVWHFVNRRFPMLVAPAFYFVGQYLIALSGAL